MSGVTQRPFDEAQLCASVRKANLPTLLMVLFQLTGDRRWLSDPYRPQRSKGLDDNDTGGFSDEVQTQVRASAVEALLAWGDGTPAVVSQPDEELLVEMISTCMGEQIADEFAPMLAEGMRGAAGPTVRERLDDPGDYRVVIIGAGVSGISAAVELKAAGVPYVVLEKNDGLGGSWWDNRYPGCGVDTPSYVYSFSYFLRRWSTYFGKRAEVQSYLEDVARTMGVYEDIRFRTEVSSAVYDEVTRTWTVTMRHADGSQEVLVANAVISAVGALSRPAMPVIAGMDRYAGQLFHSAHWPEGLDVTGKRVVVVGSGASAMQIVPAVADSVESLTVLQRSPQWVAPSFKYFDQVPPEVHWLMENVPFYHLWYRQRVSWLTNDRVHSALTIDPEWEYPERSINAVNDGHRRALTRYIVSELEGREDLQAKAVPTYPPFGKRMLLDNGWYAALRRPNVELLTAGVAEITETGLLTTDGTKVEADVIVLATGFEAKKALFPMHIQGRHGKVIRDIWGDEDARAYLGMTVPGFPNLFVMYGPNINLGHGGSYMFFGELQARYVTDIITEMITRNIGSVEVREDVHDEYNRKVDQAHSRMIWSHPGMETWYRNARGRVVTNSPWRVVDYWKLTKEVNYDDFVLHPAVALSTSS
jgi:4-hydroxyacetophenone monooxygenase